MLKEKTWVNGKQCVESDYGTFNKQTDTITTGSVYASTQRSKWIRPYGMKSWAGKEYESGELLNADMKGFKPIGNKGILDVVYDQFRKEPVILYEFFVKKFDRRGGSTRDVLGHVLTDKHDRLITYTIYVPERNSIAKRRSAVFEAMNYVVDGWCQMNDKERIMWRANGKKAG